MENSRLSIGVDVGGTKIAVACVDAGGRIVTSRKYPTQPETGSRAIIGHLVRYIQELCQEINVLPTTVGVGLAGQIDEKGSVTFAPNLNWSNVPFKDELETALRLPVTVLNDVRAATWGEWKHGAGSGQSDIVCLFIGTGIGGGVISGNRLLVGANNSAGELGHMTVMINGPLCSCGNSGCLEAFAGGWAIAKSAQQAVKNRAEDGKILLEMSAGQEITARLVVAAALEGDALSKIIVNGAIEALIAGSVGMINGLNPTRLILGGGLGDALPNLVGRVREGVLTSILASSMKGFDVVPAQLKNEAGVIGAASFALQKLKD